MMRIHWRWLLAIGLYTLLNLGANDVSAMAMHFRHWDYQLPVAIGVVTNGALIPFGIGVVLAACLGRELPGVAWPLLFAPSLLSAFEGYATDSFYAPYWKEFLSLVGVGAAQGVIAMLGWFVHQRMIRERRPATTANDLPGVGA